MPSANDAIPIGIIPILPSLGTAHNHIMSKFAGKTGVISLTVMADRN